jgi:hypothetical protein
MNTVDSQWHYSQGGNQFGPVPLQSLRGMVASGQLHGGDLVWTEGMPQWIPIAQVSALTPGTPAPTYGGTPTPTGYPSPAAVPMYYSQSGQSQQGMAIAGFVLSLVFPLLGLIFSIIALNAMKRTQNFEGRGFAKAGLIISIIQFSFFLLMIAFWCVLMVLFARSHAR